MPDWTEVVKELNRDRVKSVVYCKDNADSHSCVMLLKELGFRPKNQTVAYHFNKDNKVFKYPYPVIYRNGEVDFTNMAGEAAITYPKFLALVESLDTGSGVDESVTLADILGGELI